MSANVQNSIPMSGARSKLTQLMEEARSGQDKIITKNGEPYVALIDARRLDYYHKLERERIHIKLLEEVERGLEHVAAGRSKSASELRAKYRRRKT